MKTTLISVAMAALSLASGAAQAQALGYITWLGPRSDAISITTTHTTDFGTGGLNYKDANNQSFVAFCIEPLAPNGTQNKSVLYTSGSLSTAQSNLLQGLYSSQYSALSTPTAFAAFQLAVWEIVIDTTAPTLSVTDSSHQFHVKPKAGDTALTADVSTAAALANSFLAQAQNYAGPALYNLEVLANNKGGTTYNPLKSSGFQDLVVGTPVTPVPEAGTLAMFMAGLGTVAFVARRRRKV